MTYELEKQLKKAGFKFRKWSAGQLSQQIIWDDDEEISSELTLPELIEACGMGLSGLVRNDPMISYNFPGKSGWVALSNRKNEIGERIEIWGETSEEAIVNLWLELNKSK